MLDQLAGLWAYSTMQWLRHTIPSEDTNRGRWQLSPFWQVIQAADFSGEPIPLIRDKKRQQDLELICQMLSGCSTTAAAYLAGQLPEHDDGTHFLIWFMDGKSSTSRSAASRSRNSIPTSASGSA